jgi:hypothetical protein
MIETGVFHSCGQNSGLDERFWIFVFLKPSVLTIKRRVRKWRHDIRAAPSTDRPAAAAVSGQVSSGPAYECGMGGPDAFYPTREAEEVCSASASVPGCPAEASGALDCALARVSLRWGVGPAFCVAEVVMSDVPSRRGGRRPGAGRPRKVRRFLRLATEVSPEVLEAIKRNTPTGTMRGAGRVIERLVADSEALKMLRLEVALSRMPATGPIGKPAQ